MGMYTYMDIKKEKAKVERIREIEKERKEIIGEVVLQLIKEINDSLELIDEFGLEIVEVGDAGNKLINLSYDAENELIYFTAYNNW